MTHLAPWSLIALRVALAPVLLALAARGALTDGGFLALYVLAFATDYADGNVARWLGVATPRLRAADSAADTVFHLAVFAATWLRHPGEFATPALGAFGLTALAWYGHDAFRWRRVAGFHAKSSRAFAVAILAWVVARYGFSVEGSLGWALAVGTVANVEGLAISLALDEDRKDVPTLVHALRLRADAPRTTRRCEPRERPGPSRRAACDARPER